MSVKESGLYPILASALCCLVVLFFFISGKHHDPFFAVSMLIIALVGIACFGVSIKHHGNTLIQMDHDTLVAKDQKFRYSEISSVVTNYRGFNSDSPREIIISTTQGAIVTVNVSYVRDSPNLICERIKSELHRKRE
jgi:hypothetical protein